MVDAVNCAYCETLKRSFVVSSIEYEKELFCLSALADADPERYRRTRQLAEEARARCDAASLQLQQHRTLHLRGLNQPKVENKTV